MPPSLPFTTEAVVKGNAVMLASAVSDAPDLLPFAYGLVYTRPDMCNQTTGEVRPASPARLPVPTDSFMRSLMKALALLRKRFDRMDGRRPDRGLADRVAGSRQGPGGHGACS